MIFYYQITGNTGQPIEVPICFINLNNKSVIGYGDMCSRREAIQILESKGVMITAVDSGVKNKVGVTIPILSLIEKSDSVPCFPYNALYESFKSCTNENKDEVINQWVPYLNDWFINSGYSESEVLNDDNIIDIMNSCLIISQTLAGTAVQVIDTKVVKMSNEMSEIVENYNNLGSPLYLRNNYNSFMKTPESELNIKLPKVETVLETGRISLPDSLDIMDPYDIRNVKENSDMASYKYTARSNYRDHLGNKIPMEFITGYSSQNDVEEFPNEINFLERLCSFVDELVLAELGASSLSSSEKKELLSKLVYTGNVSKDSELLIPENIYDMLKDMALEFTVWNWRHCSSLPIGIDESSKGDDNEEGSNEESGKLMFQGVNKDGGNISTRALVTLENLLRRSTLTDLYAIPKYCIKVLRWGGRKPSRIKFPTLGKYLDFTQDGDIKTSSGNIDLLSVMKSGEKFSILKTIYLDSRVTDAKLINMCKSRIKGFGLSDLDVTRSINMPIGFLCSNLESSDNIVIIVSIYDIYESYKEGIYFINGLEHKVIDGKLELDFRNIGLEEYETTKISELAQQARNHPDLVAYYQPNSLLNFLEQSDVQIEKSNFFKLVTSSLVDDLAAQKVLNAECDNIQELADIIVSNGLQKEEVVNDFLLGQIITSLIYMGGEVNISLDEGLNSYFMKYVEILNLMDFRYGFEDNKSLDDAFTSSIEGKLQSMDVFGNSGSEKEKEKIEGEFTMNKSDLIIDSLGEGCSIEIKKVYYGSLVLDDSKKYYLSKSKKDGSIAPEVAKSIVGYVAVRNYGGKKKKYTFIEKDSLPVGMEVLNKSVNILTLLRYATFDIQFLMNNKPEDLYLSYLGDNSYTEFNKVIASIKPVV